MKYQHFYHGIAFFRDLKVSGNVLDMAVPQSIDIVSWKKKVISRLWRDYRCNILSGNILFHIKNVYSIKG